MMSEAGGLRRRWNRNLQQLWARGPLAFFGILTGLGATAGIVAWMLVWLLRSAVGRDETPATSLLGAAARGIVVAGLLSLILWRLGRSRHS